ncbi:MAG: DUF4328 domain-containing protein [Armatimonadetes bacterium]|nr:DUF4328 domain-containing protein [Armatimonadota bacterium]
MSSYSVPPQARPAFQPIGSVARFVVILLAMNAVASLIALLLGRSEIALLQRIQSGEVVTESEITMNDLVVGGFAMVQLLIVLVTVVLFFIWFYRAYYNLAALRVSGRKYAAGWAVGWWFIPIANLILPYNIAKEIWQASDPQDLAPEGNAWRRNSVTPLLGVWWLVWIVSHFADSGYLMATVAAVTIEEMIAASNIGTVTDVIDMLSALLALSVVRAITARQEQKMARLVYVPPVETPSPYPR